ncbi:MAG: aminopeptidase N, partial [Thiohalomonadaceae bacterium]
MSNTPQAIHLQDYTPPNCRIDSVDLRFELDETATTVRNTLAITMLADGPLFLHGQQLALQAITLDAEPLSEGEYSLDAHGLSLHRPPQRFSLTLTSRIHPAANTALEGLYVSGGNFCTQCEAEGFRKISWYPDRPDVMAVFTTTLVADQARFPVLLSNGNPVAREVLADGRHSVTWHDPFPKPCYLFALVAGDLACVRDRYTTVSGRELALEIYVQHGNEDKTAHAMASLKRAMRWDEQRYGREYDLDIYMIVAVDDFNMGAMENKGLNVFNSRFVLARPDTATDSDYFHIESVIAHEYFHNWSGNRVTCRDWFQLSLKEGFTVFRDQQFSADHHSPAVVRIDQVRQLRSLQFTEDAGPMAHPVRPESYVEINNFYTMTVYEKGAELIRMLHTLLGEQGFRRGSDEYFRRHDGQAVTCEDFIAAMAAANQRDLAGFMRWYHQAGTPRLTLRREFDPATQTLSLHLSQQTPATPGQPDKQPLWVPIRIALLDRETGATLLAEQVLLLEGAEQCFRFEGVCERAVPSLLRGFSAPVKLEHDLDDQELAALMAHDDDPFARWESGQQLMLRVLLQQYREGRSEAELPVHLDAAFARLLADTETDPALRAEAMALPPLDYVGEFIEALDPLRLHRLHQGLQRALALAHRAALLAGFEAHRDSGYAADAKAVARRQFRNQCLAYLALLPEGGELAAAQYRQADNMTDSLAALAALSRQRHPQAAAALADFAQRWQGDRLVMDKWFALQAGVPDAACFAEVKVLMGHPDFSLTNPNRVRAVIGSFAMRNPAAFHGADGAYAWLAEQVIALDALNPQIAARLVNPLTQWRRYDAARQQAMRAVLQGVLDSGERSADVYEVASKGLAG